MLFLSGCTRAPQADNTVSAQESKEISPEQSNQEQISADESSDPSKELVKALISGREATQQVQDLSELWGIFNEKGVTRTVSVYYIPEQKAEYRVNAFQQIIGMSNDDLQLDYVINETAVLEQELPLEEALEVFVSEYQDYLPNLQDYQVTKQSDQKCYYELVLTRETEPGVSDKLNLSLGKDGTAILFSLEPCNAGHITDEQRSIADSVLENFNKTAGAYASFECRERFIRMDDGRICVRYTVIYTDTAGTKWTESFAYLLPAET